MGMAVRKRGMTTELTYGFVDGIVGTYPYDYGPPYGIINLKNMIHISRDPNLSTSFVQAGDSGSLIVTGTFHWQIGVYVVGVLTLGSNDGSYGLANPIGQVLSELNVELYEWSIYGHLRYPKRGIIGAVAKTLEGAELDDGGWVITPGGVFQRIAPWGPPGSEGGTAAVHEVLTALAVSELAASITDPAARDSIRQAALELVIKETQRLLPSKVCAKADNQKPRPGGARSPE
jgi:hypothetical protein